MSFILKMTKMILTVFFPIHDNQAVIKRLSMKSFNSDDHGYYIGPLNNREDGRIFPEGSCDTHFHVFGNTLEFPLINERCYTPDPAAMEDYWKEFGPVGVDKCIIVQPSVYGRDHRLFKRTLRKAPQGVMRGVAVVYEDTSDREIEQLHALGVRGARCNVLFQGGVSPASLRCVADRIRGLGWHIQLLVNVDHDPGLVQRVVEMGVPVVVDHFGHSSALAGAGGRGMKNLQALLRQGPVWVKFSGAYRISETASAADPAMIAIAHSFLQANLDRILWGSDWPHPGIKASSCSGTELAQALLNWVPAEMLRNILIDNPARLYWGH